VIPNIRPRSRSATPISETEWPPSHTVQRPHPLRSSVEPALTRPPTRSPIKASNIPNPEPCSKPTARPLHSEAPELRPPSESSSPSSHLLVVEETKLLRRPPYVHTRREVLRKVPPPRQPIPIAHSQGETVILVPNSDTSLSYSQSLSQQQSSQSQSQPLNSSQPVILSQLAFLSKAQEPPGLQQGAILVNNGLAGSPVDDHPKTVFSDYPSQDYDGDRSSPNVSPSNKGAFIRASQDNDNIGEYLVGHRNDCVHRNVLSPNPHRCDKGSTELVNTSPIVKDQSPVSDGHDRDIPFDKPNAKENDARVSASEASEDPTWKRISPRFDRSHVLDDDDAQTHVILFGPSLRSNSSSQAQLPSQTQPSSQTQQPTPPASEIIPFPVLKRNGVTEAFDRSSTSPSRDSLIAEDSLHLITQSEVGQGQYDPQEWKEPSFLKTRLNAKSSITPRGQLKKGKVDGPVPSSRPTSASRTLKSSLPANEGGSSRTQGQLSNTSTTTSQQRGISSSSSHDDHKTDPSKRSMPTSLTLEQRARHEDDLTTHPGPAMGASTRLEPRSRTTKRGRSSILDDDTAENEPARERAKKKRKVVDAPRREDAGTNASRDRQAQQGSKLNGFTVNLDRIRLEDLRYPVVTWDRINEIIQGVDEDRAGQDSREMIS